MYGTIHYIHVHTGNYSNRGFSPTGFPIEEEARENIYDQHHTGHECSSPPPTGLEYYNHSAILRNQQSQHGAETSAMVLMAPSAARTKPTPPPKPKKPTKDCKCTGTHRSISIVMYC